MAGAGELHGPQKSQAVRQSRRAARLCLANNPLMSFQKTRGRKEAQLQIICFSFFLSSNKIFLPNETRGVGGRLITLPLTRGSQKRPWPALQGHRAVRVSCSWGASLGRVCPAGTRVTRELCHSIMPLTAPQRLLWESCATRGAGLEECALFPMQQVPGKGSRAPGRAQQAASLLSAQGSEPPCFLYFLLLE